MAHQHQTAKKHMQTNSLQWVNNKITAGIPHTHDGSMGRTVYLPTVHERLIFIYLSGIKCT